MLNLFYKAHLHQVSLLLLIKPNSTVAVEVQGCDSRAVRLHQIVVVSGFGPAAKGYPEVQWGVCCQPLT